MANKLYEKCGFFSRRGFVQLMASGVLSACLPSCSSDEEKALGFKPRLKHRTSFITPNEEFYLVAVEPSFRPEVNQTTVSQQWALELLGLDGAAVSVSYAELDEMANRIVPYTFECIGNRVGGSLIGNANWHVVPLKRVLERVGISSAVKSVMFEGLDDFYSSVSIERATDEYAFIATKMNGVPLPSGHGFPARVILPDLYGMKQPRWLRRITLLSDADTTSYWEKRGWAGEVPIKNYSRVNPPREVLGGKLNELNGVAFAGARGIARVEISFDGGQRWQECQLETPGQPHVWSLWSYRWQQPTSGKHTVMVRTIDLEGKIQTAERSRPYPDGASGYHTLSIDVM